MCLFLQVYLPAVEGYVPSEMLRALHALLEFCYIAQCNIHTSSSLKEMEDALDWLHHYRQIFQQCGVRAKGFNVPRQHTLIHYVRYIRAFGALNGICSSITESKHIKVMKEPWWRSSCFEAMEQMLLTNQRLDKLAAARVDFTNNRMLSGTCLSWILLKLGMLFHHLLHHLHN